MKNKNRKYVKSMTVSAIFTALGVVILSLSSVVESLDLSLCALASAIIALSYIELGSFWPWLTWLATGLLAALLLPDKFCAVAYLMFCGVYPIFKGAFERLNHPVVRWVVKLSFFNTMLLLIIAVSVYILHLQADGLAYRIAVLAAANLAFVLYDVALTKALRLYLIKLRRKLGFRNYFEN